MRLTILYADILKLVEGQSGGAPAAVFVNQVADIFRRKTRTGWFSQACDAWLGRVSLSLMLNYGGWRGTLGKAQSLLDELTAEGYLQFTVHAHRRDSDWDKETYHLTPKGLDALRQVLLATPAPQPKRREDGRLQRNVEAFTAIALHR